MKELQRRRRRSACAARSCCVLRRCNCHARRVWIDKLSLNDVQRRLEVTEAWCQCKNYLRRPVKTFRVQTFIAQNTRNVFHCRLEF